MRYQIPEPSSPAPFSTLLPALCSCGVVSLTRLFADPVWSALISGSELLPGAEELSHMKEHIENVLDAIETRSMVTELEAVLYCPLIYPISIEAKDAKSRNRVRNLYEKIAEKGIIVSLTYLSDISLIWDMIPVIGDGIEFSTHN
jgi:hypothetical protein